MNDTRMYFIVEGRKSSPSMYNAISEVDLLTDSKRSIRARQRKITTVKVTSWENLHVEGKYKYNKARLYLTGIFQN